MTTARRFALLDRDGVIIVDKHYLSDPEQVEFLPGAVEGLRQLRGLGYGLIVVTNQSGVGRGYFTLEQMHRVNERMLAELRAAGVEVEGVYFCPHAPEAGCDCRKPRSGLVKQAVRDWGFDPAACVLAGDKSSDVALARKVGARAFLIHGSQLPLEHSDPMPDEYMPDLSALARHLAEEY